MFDVRFRSRFVPLSISSSGLVVKSHLFKFRVHKNSKDLQGIQNNYKEYDGI